VIVNNWAIKEHDGTVEVSADVDGFRLWFRSPRAYSVSRTGDPFLAAALLPAMLRGEPLEIDPSLPVSPVFLQNTFLLQEIFHSWNPVLKLIHISATTSPAEPLNTGTFTFFSGGVDSTYTLLKRQEEVSHAVFIQGFDFFDDSETYATAVTRNTQFIRSLGKTLVPIETNHFPFGYRYNLSRNLTHGSCLGAVALLLGFPRVYVPASYSYRQLFPLGSHPLTDPLWSNESVTLIHDGCEAGRTDKIKRICSSEAALANLRVCFDDMNVNCGTCAKCIRTMITLKQLHASSVAFPPFPSMKVIRNRRIVDDIELAFFKENVDLALETDDADNRELRDALCACLRTNERARVWRDIERVLLGGFVKRAYRRTVKDTEIRRIGTLSANG
jgi:hypothetical protein